MFTNHNHVITIESAPADVLAVTGLSDQALAEVLKFPASASSPTGQVSGFTALLPVVNAWLKAYDADPEMKSVTDAGQREKILAFLQGTEGSPGIIEAVATLATEGARVHLVNLVGSDVPLTVAQRVALLAPLTALHTAVDPNADATLEAVLQLEEALKVKVDTAKIVPPDVADLAHALQQAQNPETPTTETPTDDAAAADASADADAPADTTPDDTSTGDTTTNEEGAAPTTEEPSASAPPLPDAPANLPASNSATITISDTAAFFQRMMQIDQELADGVSAVMQGVTGVSAGLVEATAGMQKVVAATSKKNKLVGEVFGLAPAGSPALAEKTEA